MKNILTSDVIELMDTISQHGHEARVAGGAVRDGVLGNTPKDIDLATTALPETVMDIFVQNGKKVIPTGLQHGTVTVVVNDIPYEITTLRIDSETDGRHAKVEFTDDWKLDASRRDFTFNAMYLDANGKVHDYFDGIRHIESRQIHFVGNTEDRIKEDYLRILRFFRFASRYVPNLNISWEHSYAFDIIRDHKTGLDQISGERIWSELQKIVMAPHAKSAITAMNDLEVLGQIGLNLNENFEKVKDHQNNSDFEMNSISMMSVFFKNKEYNLSNVMRDRLKASRDELRFISLAEKYKDISKLNEYIELIYDIGLEKRHVIAQLAVSNGDENFYDTLISVTKKFPVTGKDLLERGVIFGPDIGRILKFMKKYWVYSGREHTKNDLLEML